MLPEGINIFEAIATAELSDEKSKKAIESFKAADKPCVIIFAAATTHLTTQLDIIDKYLEYFNVIVTHPFNPIPRPKERENVCIISDPKMLVGKALGMDESKWDASDQSTSIAGICNRKGVIVQVSENSPAKGGTTDADFIMHIKSRLLELYATSATYEPSRREQTASATRDRSPSPTRKMW